MHKNYRGKGVGKAMLDYFEQDCKKNGIQQLMLFVNMDNDKAIQLYNKFGLNIYRKAKLMSLIDLCNLELYSMRKLINA